MNVIDFHTWGHVKSLVYRSGSDNEQETWIAIQDAFNELTPEQLQRATEHTVVRAQACIDNDGRHFEQML